MTKRVLVTRPEPGASRTARRLVALGYAAVVMPLTEVRAITLPASAVAQAGKGIDLVAITSANAVRHAPETLLAELRHLPCFAVGEETAAVARKVGFATVHVGSGDAGGLAETIAANTPLGARVIYPCGRVRRPDFEAAIEAGGRIVRAVEVYDTIEATLSERQIRSLVDGGRLDAVLLHSAMSATALLRLADRPDVREALRDATFVCISRRVADALGAAPVRVIVAATSDDDAMLESLGAI
jgi:uroporphyrinogen-III synthase